jgi:hypothetical protein
MPETGVSGICTLINLTYYYTAKLKINLKRTKSGLRIFSVLRNNIPSYAGVNKLLNQKKAMLNTVFQAL